MRWPWIRDARLIHARPGEVEEMIQRRLEERSWDEQEVRQEGWAVAAGVLSGGVGIMRNFYKNVIELFESADKLHVL